MTHEPATRVLFSCTGIGICNRGIESFFREAFDNLRHAEGIEAVLVRGKGATAEGELRARCLPRDTRLARALGRLAGRNGYVVEQWSSLPSLARAIRRFRPQVVFYSEANLGYLLHRFRRRIGVPFRLLFSNGGPCDPPFPRTHFVHQVTPWNHRRALAAGEPAIRQFLVPYGIRVPPGVPSDDERDGLRRRLGLPTDRPIVLSVGWISRRHKRMDYVVREIAALPAPRPYLVLLGAMDESSGEVLAQAGELLGAGGFAARSVPYEEVGPYYRAADCFALASLTEGFGRVYLEALMHGLPVVAHRNTVTSYVLGEEGLQGELDREGELARLLAGPALRPVSADDRLRRRRRVERRFGWEALGPAYAAMFREAARRPLAWPGP